MKYRILAKGYTKQADENSEIEEHIWYYPQYQKKFLFIRWWSDFIFESCEGYYTASFSTIEKAKEYIEEDIMWRKRKIVNVKKVVAEWDIDIQNYKKGDLDAAKG